MNSEYRTYLSSDAWKTVKALKLQDSPVCESCGWGYGLQIHHLTYDHIYNEAYHLYSLAVLCRTCHEKAHKLTTSKKNLKQKVSNTRQAKRRKMNKLCKELNADYSSTYTDQVSNSKKKTPKRKRKSSRKGCMTKVKGDTWQSCLTRKVNPTD